MKVTYPSKVIFDIETDGLNATKIWCIVAKELNGPIHKFSPDKIEEGIEFLKGVETLIGHNIIGFDIPVIERLYHVKLNNKIEDTLVMSRLFNPSQENGHSLKTWGYRVGFPKQDQPETFDTYNSRMLEYCTHDVRLNELVYQQLQTEKLGFSDTSIQLEHEVTEIINEQEKAGFLFDEQQAMMFLAKLKTRISEVEQEVQETFKPRMVDDKLITPYVKKDGTLSKRGLTKEEYESFNGLQQKDFELFGGKNTYTFKPFMRQKLQNFNLGSRKQIGEYLTSFGWKPERFTPTGQPIVDEGTLKKIKHIPEANLIAEFLLLQKRIAQLSSWIDELKDDRVHGRIISNGTITGRMTHRNPNMAQVPNIASPYGKECRACWTVPEGYKLVGIDASGLELRMLAHYMDDKEYIDNVINGDIHKVNQKLAGIQSRDKAKTFIYALIYGAGDEKLGKVVGGSRDKGRRLRDSFLTNLPALKTLAARVRKASKKGFLKGIDGRKIYIRSEHSALNSLLQGGGAIIMKKALSLLYNKIKINNLDAIFVANIHDEWQLQVKEDQANIVGQLGVEAIEDAAKVFKLRCPLTGEYKIGDNWSETH
tara:strand:- start:317 stop:2098 length:1782 start_codon:yes stop_codon:yes gene_type:complete